MSSIRQRPCKEAMRNRSAMPDLSVVPLEETTAQILELKELGISSIIIFGLPAERDAVGSQALNHNGIGTEDSEKTQNGIREYSKHYD